MTTPKTSNEALVFWQRIAEGERDSELDNWLKSVAARIVNDVFRRKFEAANRRPDAALKAIGWRERLKSFSELAELAREDTGMSEAQLAKVADLLVDVPNDPKKIRNKINYARKKK